MTDLNDVFVLTWFSVTSSGLLQLFFSMNHLSPLSLPRCVPRWLSWNCHFMQHVGMTNSHFIWFFHLSNFVSSWPFNCYQLCKNKSKRKAAGQAHSLNMQVAYEGYHENLKDLRWLHSCHEVISCWGHILRPKVVTWVRQAPMNRARLCDIWSQWGTVGIADCATPSENLKFSRKYKSITFRTHCKILSELL